MPASRPVRSDPEEELEAYDSACARNRSAGLAFGVLHLEMTLVLFHEFANLVCLVKQPRIHCS